MIEDCEVRPCAFSEMRFFFSPYFLLYSACLQRLHPSPQFEIWASTSHRLRPFHEDARFPNGVGMFCNAPPNPEHPPVCHSFSTPVVDCSSDVDETRLDYGCSTMVVRCDNWIDSSRFSMRLPDSSTRPVEVNTCLHFSVISTGFESRSELSSVSLSSPTVAWTVSRWRVTACGRHQFT